MKRAVLAMIGAAVATAGLAAERGRPAPSPEAVQAVHRFGTCVVDRRPRDARAVLALDFTTPEYGRALRRLSEDNSSCMPAGADRGRFDPILVAGAMAERLVAGQDLTSALAYDASRPALAARNDMEVTAICLAHAQPAQVAALFKTQPMTPEEGAAVRELSPALTDCVRKGQEVRMSRAGLRAVLATASYRIVQSGGAPAKAN